MQKILLLVFFSFSILGISAQTSRYAVANLDSIKTQLLDENIQKDKIYQSFLLESQRLGEQKVAFLQEKYNWVQRRVSGGCCSIEQLNGYFTYLDSLTEDLKKYEAYTLKRKQQHLDRISLIVSDCLSYITQIYQIENDYKAIIDIKQLAWFSDGVPRVTAAIFQLTQNYVSRFQQQYSTPLDWDELASYKNSMMEYEEFSRLYLKK